MKILSFGEILWDVYTNKRCLGGAPLNFAAHAKRCGAESFLYSAVGEDELGKEARAEVSRLGIDDRFLTTVFDRSTGKCIVTLNEKSVPKYDLLEDVAYDRIPFDERFKRAEFDVFAFGTLALRGEYNRRTFQKMVEMNVGKRTYCDLNLRSPFYDRDTLELCLRSTNILKLSEEEFATVSKTLETTGVEQKDFLEALTNKYDNLEMVVVTLGEKGAFAYDCRLKVFEFCKAIKTDVVSTVGAGDAFGATFLVSYLQGVDLETCLQRGTECSAFVVSRQEAIPSE